MKGKAGQSSTQGKLSGCWFRVPKVETAWEGWRPSTSSCGVAMWLLTHLPLHAPLPPCPAPWIPPGGGQGSASPALQRSADLGPQFSPDPFLPLSSWRMLIKKLRFPFVFDVKY